MRMLPLLMVSLGGLMASQAGAAARLTYDDLVSRLTDMERLAEPVVEGESTGASTSHDRGSVYDPAADVYQNWAANDDGRGFIRREGDGQVMVDLQGPGVLWRVWSAKPESGHIRIYLDGNGTPVIDQPFHAFFDSLEKEFPGLVMTLSRGRNAFVPIPFAKSCKVVMQDGWGAYFHATHTRFPEGAVVESFPGFTPDVKAALKRAGDSWTGRGGSPYQTSGVVTKRTFAVSPGGSQSLELTGAAALRMLKVKPLDPPADRVACEDMLRELTISIRWDGGRNPDVWAPLGDFFATAPGLNPFKTRPMGCVDGEFYSFWFMPFARGMRLEIGNDGSVARRLDLMMETVKLDPREAASHLRFRAAWHAGDFTGLDSGRFLRKGGDRWPDWPLLVVRGGGRFVGMSQHVWKFGGWWGEGDEKFFVDGEKFPSTIGTGSEDYIGYAWAADPPFVTFDSPCASVSRIRPDANEDTSVCRFHLCDDIPFRSGFQGFIEVMPNADCRPVMYDQCVYWYGEAGAVNPYPVVPPARRVLARPSSEMKHILPPTYQTMKAKPGTMEGESLKVLRIGSGRAWVQDMSGFPGDWCGGGQLIWTEGKPGDVMEIEFTVDHGGRVKLFAAFTRAADYGIFELGVDGIILKPQLDLFAGHVGRTDEILLGDPQLSPGRHTLKVKAVGRNPRVRAGATGDCLFGLDYLRAEPTR